MMNEKENYWKKKAQSVAWLVNSAWWMQAFLPLFVGINVVWTGLLLIFRQRELELSTVWWAYLAGTLLAGGLAVWRVRGRWFSQVDGMVRLEEYLHLNSRLTAAMEGQATWPEPQPVPEDAPGLSYIPRPGPVLGPIFFSLVVLWAGTWIPVPGVADDNLSLDAEEPAAWKELQGWMDQLKEEEIVDEEKIEEIEDKLAELRQQPSEQWFQQGSLEAGQNLREQTREGIENLFMNMHQAAEVVAALEAGENTPSGLQDLQSRLDAAMQNMQMGTLPLNREMLEQLKNADCKNCSLTSDQLKQLADKLKEGCKACEGLGCLSQMALAECSGENPGRGGINRGRGDAPLGFKEDTNLADLQVQEGLSNEDMERATLGDVLQVTEGPEPDTEGGYEGLQNSGAADYSGRGGEAVWKNNLTPEEQKVLRGYFQ